MRQRGRPEVLTSGRGIRAQTKPNPKNSKCATRGKMLPYLLSLAIRAVSDKHSLGGRDCRATTVLTKNQLLRRNDMRIACAALALLLPALPAPAQNVKITPIGSHPGELCANDRAIIFEDPTGVRFLYDAGPTVTGGNDPRLGTIHLVLLTHMHGDHVGDLKLKAPGEGTCANSARVPAPNSTTGEVVAAKSAVLVTTRAMAAFIHNKVEAIRGSGSKR